jgi:hypothetical protein
MLPRLGVSDEIQRGELAFVPIAHSSLQPLILAGWVDPALADQ